MGSSWGYIEHIDVQWQMMLENVEDMYIYTRRSENLEKSGVPRLFRNKSGYECKTRFWSFGVLALSKFRALVFHHAGPSGQSA